MGNISDTTCSFLYYFLTNYIYISLDTFHSVSQNINSYLDAWFTFLSSDSPEDILRLIEAYPEFKAYYHDISLFRKKPKELMNMYSEALLQMDKNTANYMIEEMKKEMDELHNIVAEKLIHYYIRHESLRAFLLN